jgi:phage anti-repressor protein
MICYCRNDYVNLIRESDINYDFVEDYDWDGINKAVKLRSLKNL